MSQGRMYRISTLLTTEYRTPWSGRAFLKHLWKLVHGLYRIVSCHSKRSFMAYIKSCMLPKNMGMLIDNLILDNINSTQMRLLINIVRYGDMLQSKIQNTHIIGWLQYSHRYHRNKLIFQIAQKNTVEKVQSNPKQMLFTKFEKFIDST